LQMGPTTDAILRSLATLVLALTMLQAGRWAERWGLRRAAVLGAVALGCSSLFNAAAWDGASMAAARAVTGMATALLFAAGLAVLAKSYKGRALTVACSLWLAWDAAAILGSGPLGGAMIDAFGWRSAYLLTAVIALTTAVACRLLLPPLPALPLVTGSPGRLRPLLRHPGFLAAGTVGLAFNFANGFFLGAYPILGAQTGVPAATVGLVISLIGGGSIIGALGAGFARSKLGMPGRLMYFTGLGALIAAAVLQLLTSYDTRITVPTIGCVIVGIAVMWVQQPQSELMFQIAGPERTAAIAPVKTSLGQLGMAGGLAAAGPVLSLFSSAGPTGSYGAGSAAAALVPLAATITLGLLLRKNPQGH
jgi:DHA2 family multidrug resistance protein-like MFS transporter